MILTIVVLTVLLSIAASIVTTRCMAMHCFKIIDNYLEEVLEAIKKVSLDALEVMKDK